MCQAEILIKLSGSLPKPIDDASKNNFTVSGR